MSKALPLSKMHSALISFVIANDTGPAHMASHLGIKGLSYARENSQICRDEGWR